MEEERETNASKKKGKQPMVEEPSLKNPKKAKVVEKQPSINKNHPFLGFTSYEEVKHRFERLGDLTMVPGRVMDENSLTKIIWFESLIELDQMRRIQTF